MKVIAVIPARYASTRFPGKLLKDLAGESVLLRTVTQARKAARLDEVWVATDDHRIAKAMDKAGVAVCMTDPSHTSGTDRIAEAVAEREAEVVVNVQGDEPFVDPGVIDDLVERMEAEDRPEMGTACTPIHNAGELEDASVVKLVRDVNGCALYFSRSLIPHSRDVPARDLLGQGVYFRHLGLYAYRRSFLMKWRDLPPHPLEEVEKLEQLRALAHGARIAVIETGQTAPGIDTPADLEAAKAYLTSNPEDRP